MWWCTSKLVGSNNPDYSILATVHKHQFSPCEPKNINLTQLFLLALIIKDIFHISRVRRIVTSGCHVPWISWISTDLRKTEKKCICVTSTSFMTCIFPPAATRKPLLRSNFMLMTCHGQTDLYIPTSGTLLCINLFFCSDWIFTG